MRDYKLAMELVRKSGNILLLGQYVGCEWRGYRELCPILTFKDASWQLKGKIYYICMRSCILLDTKT